MPGGDPVRAAAINRAFAALRAGDGPREAVRIEPPSPSARLHGANWPVRILLGAGLLALASATMDRLDLADWRSWPGSTAAILSGGVPQAGALAPMPPSAIPANVDAIEAGVAEALRLSQVRDAIGAERVSQLCQRELRRSPGAALAYHCIAFDLAIGLLHDASGPAFAADVVGARTSAAAQLSSGHEGSDGAVLTDAHLADVRRVTRDAVEAVALPLSAIDTSGAERP